MKAMAGQIWWHDLHSFFGITPRFGQFVLNQKQADIINEVYEESYCIASANPVFQWDNKYSKRVMKNENSKA